VAACERCQWDAHRVPLHTWTAEIAYSLPSQNDLGGNHQNGYTYRRYRNELARLLKDQLNAIPRAERFRVGIITRVYGLSAKGKQKRAYDWENLVGGCKPLIDTLRDYAVIVDDNPGNWRGYYEQVKSPDGIDRVKVQLLEY
jgi:hypothetical protein